MARTYRSSALTKLLNAAFRRRIERGRGDPRKHLLEEIPMIRPCFDVAFASSLEEIGAEAHRHPVFRIEPLGGVS